jgi:hypothetical protein
MSVPIFVAILITALFMRGTFTGLLRFGDSRRVKGFLPVFFSYSFVLVFLLSATAILWPTLPALAQTPTSITVWPPNPTIYFGQTENFAALSGDGTTFAFGDASAIHTSAYFDCAMIA